MRRPRGVLAMVGVFALAVGACGSGNDTRTPPASPASDRDDAQQFVQSEVANGVRLDTYKGAVVVVRRGSSRQVVTGGVTDTQSQTPVTEHDRFFIGSVSKTILAAALLRLVEQGRMDLDDTVEQWLPDLLAEGDPITIRQLLSHTSGLANFTDHPDIFRPRPATLSPVQLVEIAESMPSMFDPGQATAYSNTNFVVLGLIVEEVTGKPLSTVLQQTVFQPLGLTSATADASRSRDPPLVHAYFEGGDSTPPDWLLPRLWGAGGVVMSPRDLDRFLQALIDGSLLAPSSLKLMMTRQTQEDAGLDYGLGLGRWETDCGMAYGHDGDIPGGYSTEAWIMPSEQRSVVVTLNANGSAAHSSADALAEAALCP